MTTLARAPRRIEMGRDVVALAALYTAGALHARPVPCLSASDDRAPSPPPSEPPRGERNHRSLPIFDWTDEELEGEIASLEASTIGSTVVWRETMRRELERRRTVPETMRSAIDAKLAVLTEAQRDGRACVRCGGEDGAMVPRGEIDGVQVFAHEQCGTELVDEADSAGSDDDDCNDEARSPSTSDAGELRETVIAKLSALAQEAEHTARHVVLRALHRVAGFIVARTIDARADAYGCIAIAHDFVDLLGTEQTTSVILEEHEHLAHLADYSSGSAGHAALVAITSADWRLVVDAAEAFAAEEETTVADARRYVLDALLELAAEVRSAESRASDARAVDLALCTAASRGWLLLAVPELPELVQVHGRILRYNDGAPQAELAIALRQTIEEHEPRGAEEERDDEQQPMRTEELRQLSPIVLQLVARYHIAADGGAPNLRELLPASWGGPVLALAVEALGDLDTKAAADVLSDALLLLASGPQPESAAFLDGLAVLHDTQPYSAADAVLERAGIDDCAPIAIALHTIARLGAGHEPDHWTLVFEALRAIAGWLRDEQHFTAIGVRVLELAAEHRAGLRGPR